MDSFKDQLKMLLIERKLTLTQLVQMLNEKYKRNDSVQNLNNKLRKETIRYSEVVEIAEVLGYQIKWMLEFETSKALHKALTEEAHLQKISPIRTFFTAKVKESKSESIEHQELMKVLYDMMERIEDQQFVVEGLSEIVKEMKEDVSKEVEESKE